MGRGNLAVRGPSPRRSGVVAEIGWTLLATLLAGLLAAAFLHDRAGWPGLVAGEATYLMQAESLAEDGDLTYTRADFDRLLLRWHGDPSDLDLVSGSGGEGGSRSAVAARRITFDRPFPYALYLAPFLAWRPENGFAIANALLLALVSLFAARTLERRHGVWAPLMVAVLVFASVVFAYTFLATGDLFLFAVTVAAFCLLAPAADSGVRPAGVRAAGVRAAAAGALLAIPCVTEPLTVPLLAAAFLVPAAEHRATARRALAAGVLAMLAAIAAARWLSGGGLPFADQGFRFTPETGFPLVDFPAAEWPQALARLRSLGGEAPFTWGVPPAGLDLWGWSLVDLFLGRAIGLLPYFAPLILLLPGGGRRRGQRAIVAAAALWVVAVVVLRPCDLSGGPGAVANRLFLPVYGALWLAAGRPAGAPRRLAALGLTLALAALFLGRLWADPGAYPIAEGRGDRHPTAVARAILPYETTQLRRPGTGPPGSRWSEHNGLWVQPLDDGVWVEARRRRLVAAGGPAELLVASAGRLAAFRLELEGDAGRKPAAGGGMIGEPGPSPGGGTTLRLRPRGLRRRHPVGWNGERRYLYRLAFELPQRPGRPVGLRLIGETAAER